MILNSKYLIASFFIAASVMVIENSAAAAATKGGSNVATPKSSNKYKKLAQISKNKRVEEVDQQFESIDQRFDQQIRPDDQKNTPEETERLRQIFNKKREGIVAALKKQREETEELSQQTDEAGKHLAEIARKTSDGIKENAKLQGDIKGQIAALQQQEKLLTGQCGKNISTQKQPTRS